MPQSKPQKRVLDILLGHSSIIRKNNSIRRKIKTTKCENMFKFIKMYNMTRLNSKQSFGIGTLKEREKERES